MLAPWNVRDVVALLNSKDDPITIELDHNRFCATPFGGWGRTTGLSEQEQTLCSRLAFQGGSGDALMGCAVKASNGVPKCTKTGPIEKPAGMFWTEAQAVKGAMDYKNDATQARPVLRVLRRNGRMRRNWPRA